MRQSSKTPQNFLSKNDDESRRFALLDDSVQYNERRIEPVENIKSDRYQTNVQSKNSSVNQKQNL
jgi:hypothetical protein